MNRVYFWSGTSQSGRADTEVRHDYSRVISIRVQEAEEEMLMYPPCG